MSVKEPVSYLQAKIRIGSCKGPVSYTSNQVVFHHDDIPDKARRRAAEVKDYARSHTLDADIPGWRNSVKPKEEKFDPVERRNMENFVKDRTRPYQYNYRSESLDCNRLIEPIDKPTKFHISKQLTTTAEQINMISKTNPVQKGSFKRTEEMPIHPNLADSTPWNNGTRLPYSVQEKNLNLLTQKALYYTSKNFHKFDMEDYLTPIEQTKKIGKDLRSLKETGNFNVKNIINGQILLQQKASINNSNNKRQKQLQQSGSSSSSLSSSPNKSATYNTTNSNNLRPATAPVIRNEDNEKYDTGESINPKTQYKNRQAVEKSRKYKTNTHSGNWEYNKIEKKFMWSDTGSFIYDSRGDIVTVHNPDAYNLEGPTGFRDIPKRDPNHYCSRFEKSVVSSR